MESSYLFYGARGGHFNLGIPRLPTLHTVRQVQRVGNDAVLCLRADFNSRAGNQIPPTMLEAISTPRGHGVGVPNVPPHQQRPRLVQPRAVHQADAQQKAACFSAILSRFCTQLDALQSWLQCSEDGRNLAARDARAKVEALESVETSLEKLRAALLGAGAPNRAAQLLRQADREQALQDARETDEMATCTPQVLLLLHNLASSAARMSSHLAQALRTPSVALLERLDDNVEELVLRAKKDLILAAGWGATRPHPRAETEAAGRTRSRLHMMLQQSADDSMRDSARSSVGAATTEGDVQSGNGASSMHTSSQRHPCSQHCFASGPVCRCTDSTHATAVVDAATSSCTSSGGRAQDDAATAATAAAPTALFGASVAPSGAEHALRRGVWRR